MDSCNYCGKERELPIDATKNNGKLNSSSTTISFVRKQKTPPYYSVVVVA